MCIGQVFVACLEYAVVMKKSSFTKNVSHSQIGKPEAGQYPISRETQQKYIKKVDLDGWSLMLFPLAFVFMVSVYAFIFF